MVFLPRIFRTREQSNLVRQGCSILIGTPGRVNDFKNKFVYLLDEVEFFILDEADKLLEMSKFFCCLLTNENIFCLGFYNDIMSVQKELNPPEERTQAFFSATMPNQVQQLAADCLNKYIFLVIGIVGAANKNVDQKFFRCDDKKQKFKIVSYPKFLKTSLTQDF